MTKDFFELESDDFAVSMWQQGGKITLGVHNYGKFTTSDVNYSTFATMTFQQATDLADAITNYIKRYFPEVQLTHKELDA